MSMYIYMQSCVRVCACARARVYAVAYNNAFVCAYVCVCVFECVYSRRRRGKIAIYTASSVFPLHCGQLQIKFHCHVVDSRKTTNKQKQNKNKNKNKNKTTTINFNLHSRIFPSGKISFKTTHHYCWVGTHKMERGLLKCQSCEQG